MLSLLANVAIPEAAKTFCSSWAAAGFRILITPIDAFKTTLQVQGTAGLAVLSERIAADGVLPLWSGALATSFAPFMGHYPWFVTFNYLNAKWEEPKGGVMKLVRRAIIGVCSSCVSDVVSNSIRVVKTAKQTSREAVSYLGAASAIVATDGIAGLMFRGLTTKIISNGVQAMLFTVCWRYFEEKLAAYNRRRLEQKRQEDDDDEKKEA